MPHVHRQGGLATEAPAACTAGDLHGARLEALVDLQSLLKVKPLAARGAAVGLVRAVHLHVFGEVALVDEALVAEGAAVGPLTRVALHVGLQGPALTEAVAALGACEGLLPRVHPHVDDELGLAGVGFVAHRTDVLPGGSWW